MCEKRSADWFMRMVDTLSGFDILGQLSTWGGGTN